jgi:FkbM family methyltransferase
LETAVSFSQARDEMGANMNYRVFLRKTLNKILAPLDLSIVRRIPLRKSDVLEVLKKAGLKPGTVIDVGVHRDGTSELYEAFPEVKTVLIEPNEEFEADILKMCRTMKDVEYIKAAATNVSGKGTLEVVRTRYVHASLVDQVNAGHPDGLARDMKEVEMVTLDDLCRRRKFPDPYLIKVDVDGKDLEVLQGATDALKRTDCVIIEAPLHHLTLRASFLEQRGFFLYAIIEPFYARDVLWQVDLVFLNDRFKNDQSVRPWLAKGYDWYMS